MMTLKRAGQKWSIGGRWFKSAKSAFVEQLYGIKTLYEPSQVSVDIVFIHGITGHRDHTWSASSENGPWPRALLPTRIIGARILTFGYDASVIRWGSSISHNRIGDHSRNLLSALAAHRALDGSDLRPIIFVAHSLGGLVVKDALLASKTSPESHLQPILGCVRGILFLGTPHTGSDLAVVAERLARIAGVTTRANLKIVEVLRRDSEVLARIQNEFHSLLRMRSKEGYPPIRITCYYEELPLAGVGIIVPKHSAILPGYTAIGIRHDHRNIARFSTPDDPGFVSISGELRRWIKEITSCGGAVETEKQLGSQEDLGDFIADYTSPGGRGDIKIWGTVINSSVVNGVQTIHGNLTFGG